MPLNSDDIVMAFDESIGVESRHIRACRVCRYWDYADRRWLHTLTDCMIECQRDTTQTRNSLRTRP